MKLVWTCCRPVGSDDGRIARSICYSVTSTAVIFMLIVLTSRAQSSLFTSWRKVYSRVRDSYVSDINMLFNRFVHEHHLFCKRSNPSILYVGLQDLVYIVIYIRNLICTRLLHSMLNSIPSLLPAHCSTCFKKSESRACNPDASHQSRRKKYNISFLCEFHSCLSQGHFGTSSYMLEVLD